MSLAVAPLSAVPPVQRPARPAERGSDQQTPAAGSFGEALSRASRADEPATKPRDKTSGDAATRRQGEPLKDSQDPAEPALLAGLALLALNARTPARALGSTALANDASQPAATDPQAQGLRSALWPAPDAAALESDARQPAIADSPARALATTFLPAQDAAALSGTDIDRSLPAEPALVAMLAAPGSRERGTSALNAKKEASPLDHYLANPLAAPFAAPADAAPAAASPAAADTPARKASLLRSPDFQPAGASAEKTDSTTPAFVPVSANSAAGQAGSDAPPELEALIESISASDFTAPPASAETGLAPGPAMVGLAAQMPANIGGATAAPAAPVFSPSLPQDVGSSEWGKALGQQLLQMGQAGQGTAELQLNPPGLGPLKIVLSMNDQQIQAAFVSAHASVRAAVEAALPQLRAAMADSGISLGEASVGADSRQPANTGPGQERRPGQGSYPVTRSRELASGAERAVTGQRSPDRGNSVDIYA